MTGAIDDILSAIAARYGCQVVSSSCQRVIASLIRHSSQNAKHRFGTFHWHFAFTTNFVFIDELNLLQRHVFNDGVSFTTER